MPTRNSMKHPYSTCPKSASPLLMNRRRQDLSESEDNQDPEDGEDDLEDQDSYENPANILENELESADYTETAPTEPACEELETTYNGESLEDLRKCDLRDLIYKLFLNIYNSEKENTTLLKNEIFPKINEMTKLDDYITYAISSCMDHVKEELQLYIKKNLKCQRNKAENPQKSMINDSTFIPIEENLAQYNELIDKIIDFYELFKCSIDHIVEVWKEKLGHIEKLDEIFEIRHKKLFSVNIWQDKEIVEVIKLFFNQHNESKEYKKRTEEIKSIDEALTENNQYNIKEVRTIKQFFSLKFSLGNQNNQEK